MKHLALSLCAAAVLAGTPALARGAALTEAQIEAVVNLVESFGAEAGIVKGVEDSLRGRSSSEGVFKAKTGASSAATTTDWIKLKSFLKVGSSGEDVEVLQKLLASDPALYPEALVTGFFGPLTELAVKRLQAKLEIDQVGAVGPQTLAKINELLTGISADDLANSRIKIEVKIKDGKQEIKFEVKCDSSGSGNSCKDSGDDDSDDDDEDEDEESDEDEDD